MAATAFGKNCLFGMQFHSAHIIIGWIAILANAHITCCHAFDAALIIIQNLGCGKAGINFNAKRFGLFAKPAAKITK